MSDKMKTTIVAGIFTIIVAVIGGIFLLISTLIEGGFIITGPGVQVGNPQAEEKTPTPATVINPTTSGGQGNRISTPQNYSVYDLDLIFGVGKWHCVDGFPTAVSIDNVPENFVVQSPFTRVDKNDKFYYPGDTVPSGGYATGWLQENLPNSNCSTLQPEITQDIINEVLGSGNWYCLTQYPTGVKVQSVPANFVVASPVLYVDKNDIRYYKGDTVPSGGLATVWFPNEIPTSECP